MVDIFSEKDLSQINEHGLRAGEVERQLESFRNGFRPLDILRPATPGDGITVIDTHEAANLTEIYEEAKDGLRIVKFVPASGAATRMFKDLFEFLGSGAPNQASQTVAGRIKEFAFSDEVTTEGTAEEIIASVIDYGAPLPKALINFHRYGTEVRTALEEHLTEGALYADSNGTVNIHFTVSPEHRAGFERLVRETEDKYAKRHGVTYRIEYSEQSPSTDTIAVNPDNSPFRNGDGTLLFRPAGHGALLANLDRLDADLVFIKNIDNVTTDRLRADTVKYKKVMAGLLLKLQRQVFEYIDRIDSGEGGDAKEITDFIEHNLGYTFGEGLNNMPQAEKTAEIRCVLDRPIRVCAMVRNEGEPGGGPFHVRDTHGNVSLQIGEPSQVAPGQKELLREGTHFNPADLVCGIRDHKGEKFDLPGFVDPSTGFISEKTKDGKPLLAMELPGLWNGAMARWNTVFIEVPASTFTPVKTVTDLLRPQHQ